MNAVVEPPALEATGLGRRYGRTWALKDCSLRLPRGRVVALVGPNGAGKTTLMQLAVGVLSPSTGALRVVGEEAGSPAALGRVAFVAQDKPLYHEFTVAELLRFGRMLNPRWDQDFAQKRLEALEIPLDRKSGKLSGGQRAQVAITLALAKLPELLLLDEPLANLDPLARYEVMRGLMTTVADREVTAVLSSHVLADLAEVCDHLVLLARGQLQVAGDIEDLLAEHKLLVGRRRRGDPPPAPHTVVSESLTARQASYLVRLDGKVLDPHWAVRDASLEELVLAYMRTPDAAALPRPALASNGPGSGPTGGS